MQLVATVNTQYIFFHVSWFKERLSSWILVFAHTAGPQKYSFITPQERYECKCCLQESVQKKRLTHAQLPFTLTLCYHVISVLHQFHSHLPSNRFVTRRILSLSLLMFIRQPAVILLPMETTEIKAIQLSVFPFKICPLNCAFNAVHKNTYIIIRKHPLKPAFLTPTDGFTRQMRGYISTKQST